MGGTPRLPYHHRDDHALTRVLHTLYPPQHAHTRTRPPQELNALYARLLREAQGDEDALAEKEEVEREVGRWKKVGEKNVFFTCIFLPLERFVCMCVRACAPLLPLL